MPGRQAGERACPSKGLPKRLDEICCRLPPTEADGPRLPEGWYTATALSMLCGSASSCMHRHGGSSPERAAAARACETNLDPDNRLSLAAECTTRASSPRSAPHLPRLTLGLSASRHAPRCLSHSCTLGLPCRWQNARPLIAHPSSPYAPCSLDALSARQTLPLRIASTAIKPLSGLSPGSRPKSARLLRMIAVRSLRLPPCCGANGQRQSTSAFYIHAYPCLELVPLPNTAPGFLGVLCIANLATMAKRAQYQSPRYRIRQGALCGCRSLGTGRLDRTVPRTSVLTPLLLGCMDRLTLRPRHKCIPSELSFCTATGSIQGSCGLIPRARAPYASAICPLGSRAQSERVGINAASACHSSSVHPFRCQCSPFAQQFAIR
ncbi:hypothetical protein L1887_57833 [Cichorium endivia]|nr:hypothetical protein L1887_57833 [Cichorium endivia]